MNDDIPEPNYMETSRGRTAWWMFDGGDGIPAVLVHGGPGDGCNPAKGERMALGRRIYMYDQLGCGMSSPIPDLSGWSAEDYADELSEFLEYIGEKKVVLIGASWGAGLIVTYLGKYGMTKVAATVLVSPFLSASWWRDDAFTNLKTLGEAQYLGVRAYLDGSAPRETYLKIMEEYYSEFLFTRDCNRDIAISAANSEPNEVYLAMCGPNDIECTGTLAEFDVTDVLPKISVPVLYMCGDSDEVTLPTMLAYVESTLNSRLSVIPYAGHAVSFEQFGLYRSAISAFLTENGL